MPYFLCRTAAEDGRVEVRSLLAPSADECRRMLEAEGILILSVRRDWNRLEAQGLRLGRKVKDKDVILFKQELVAVLRAGHPILKSLEAIAGRAKNIYLKEILVKAAEEVRRGKALSEAFQPYERLFSPVYTASLMAGEKGGNLPASVGRYIQYARVVSRTRARIKSALTYPTLLILFAFILMGILVNFVLPQFADFYKSFEAELPRITRLLMSAALVLSRQWYVPLALLAVLVLTVLRLRRRPDFRLHLDRLKLRVPLGRAIWLESGLSLFSRTLGLLLEAGIPLLSSVGVATQAIPNEWLVRRLAGVPDSIRNGDSLSESLAKAAAFPPLALDMIRIGESSANLQGMLADMADFYDERVNGKIETLVNLVEPVVIIFMGLVVAAMLLSVYLPIFNIIRVAR